MKLLLKLNYEEHFRAHLDAGQDFIENFNLSYKSIIRLDVLVGSVNADLDRYHKEFSNVLQQNNEFINSILNKNSAVYIDVKKIIRDHYKLLTENQVEKPSFQRSIFIASLKSKYLYNPHIDSDVAQGFIDECNSRLSKLMILSIEASKLESAFFNFLHEYDKLKRNLEASAS